jgi:hypothetical protein
MVKLKNNIQTNDKTGSFLSLPNRVFSCLSLDNEGLSWLKWLGQLASVWNWLEKKCEKYT